MLQSVNKPDDICAARQVGARTGLPQRLIYRLIAEGKIPVIRAGRTKYVNCTLLLEQIKKGEGAIFE